MKYLKKFNTESEYQTFKNGDDYVTPNISLVKSSNGLVLENKKEIIQFYVVAPGICINTYQAYEGMTWKEYIDSGFYNVSTIPYEEDLVSPVYDFKYDLNTKKVLIFTNGNWYEYVHCDETGWDTFNNVYYDEKIKPEEYYTWGNIILNFPITLVEGTQSNEAKFLYQYMMYKHNFGNEIVKGIELEEEIYYQILSPDNTLISPIKALIVGWNKDGIGGRYTDEYYTTYPMAFNRVNGTYSTSARGVAIDEYGNCESYSYER